MPRHARHSKLWLERSSLLWIMKGEKTSEKYAWFEPESNVSESVGCLCWDEPLQIPVTLGPCDMRLWRCHASQWPGHINIIITIIVLLLLLTTLSRARVTNTRDIVTLSPSQLRPLLQWIPWHPGLIDRHKVSGAGERVVIIDGLPD